MHVSLTKISSRRKENHQFIIVIVEPVQLIQLRRCRLTISMLHVGSVATAQTVNFCLRLIIHIRQLKDGHISNG